jgi:hypothetical protein
MATTPGGLPYPVGTDLVVNGDDAIKALAEALDPRIQPDTPWTVYTPTVGGMTLGNGTAIGRYQRVRRTLDLNLRLAIGTTTTFSGDFVVNLPVGMAAGPSNAQTLTALLYDYSTGLHYLSTGFISAGSSQIFFGLNASFVAAGTRPFAWSSSDQITASGRIELAAAA